MVCSYDGLDGDFRRNRRMRVIAITGFLPGQAHMKLSTAPAPGHKWHGLIPGKPGKPGCLANSASALQSVFTFRFFGNAVRFTGLFLNQPVPFMAGTTIVHNKRCAGAWLPALKLRALRAFVVKALPLRPLMPHSRIGQHFDVDAADDGARLEAGLPAVCGLEPVGQGDVRRRLVGEFVERVHQRFEV
jgi:hypothetical protein